MKVVLAVSLVLGICTSATAQVMPAVAVSPDGTTVLAAGDNRVVYTLNAETLAVDGRRYVAGLVRWLDYSADGRLIFVRTDNNIFTARAARSFKTAYAVEDISAVSYAPQADRIALLESNYDGGVLHVLVASTGEMVNRVEFPEIRTNYVALADDGASALLLTQSDRSDDEPKENPASELKGYDRYLFRQQNDGYTSQVVSVSVESGEWTLSDTFYRVSFPGQVRMLDGRMAIINGPGDSALVSADGSTDLLNLGSGYIAFGRISDAGSDVVLTGGTDIAVHSLDGAVAAETASHELETARLDGPAERVTAIDEAADGTLYMVTSGYRIWKVAPGALEADTKPVY